MSGNWNRLSETIGSIFGDLEYGVDIATALAITGSAALFLLNLRSRNKSAKKLSLNKAVRSAVLSELTASIRRLSHVYQSEAVKAGSKLNVVANVLTETYESNEVDNLGIFRAYSSTIDQAVERADQVRDGSLNFIQMLSTEMYVVFGLLDSFADGPVYINQLRENRSDLVALTNKYAKLRHLHDKLIEIINIVSDNGDEAGTLPQESKYKIIATISQLVKDESLRDYIDTLLPTGMEEEYWQIVKSEELSEGDSNMIDDVILTVVTSIELRPCMLLLNTVKLFHSIALDIQTECKETLVILAAITHALTQDEEEHQTIDEIVKRYRGEEYFAVGSEII